MTSELLKNARAAWLCAALLASAACSPAMPGTDSATGDALSESRTPPDVAPPLDAAPDAQPEASVDAAVDGPFVTATHAPLPQVPNQGGRTIAHPQVVTITWADDPQRAPIDDFVQWLVHSSWLPAVTGEYGGGAGSVLGVQHRTETAPVTITSTQLEAQLAADVRSGALPVPADHDLSSVVYMVFLPGTSTISLPSRAMSCTQFTGFHGEFASLYGSVAYTVVVNCGGSQFGTPESDYTYPGSHELAEAMTDSLPRTHPAYRVPSDNPWAALGTELTDLCFYEPPYQSTPEGNVLTSSWSNQAAAAGGNPCVPAPPGENFFSVEVGPDALQTVDAGQTVVYTLRGWSQRPMADWHLTLYPLGGDPGLRGRLGATTLNNGGTTTFTVVASASVASGAFAKWALLLTSGGAQHAVPLVAVVP